MPYSLCFSVRYNIANFCGVCGVCVSRVEAAFTAVSRWCARAGEVDEEFMPPHGQAAARRRSSRQTYQAKRKDNGGNNNNNMRLTERQHSECKIKCHRGVCCCFFLLLSSPSLLRHLLSFCKSLLCSLRQAAQLHFCCVRVLHDDRRTTRRGVLVSFHLHYQRLFFLYSFALPFIVLWHKQHRHHH